MPRANGISAAPGGHMGRCCVGRHSRGAGRGSLIEPAVLAALGRGDGHGYDLRSRIGELTGGTVDVDAGGLYRTLRRLEEDGFVRSRWAAGDAGPQRREYELTAEGAELAADWVGHLEERARIAGMLARALESDAPSETGEE